MSLKLVYVLVFLIAATQALAKTRISQSQFRCHYALSKKSDAQKLAIFRKMKAAKIHADFVTKKGAHFTGRIHLVHPNHGVFLVPTEMSDLSQVYGNRIKVESIATVRLRAQNIAPHLQRKALLPVDLAQELKLSGLPQKTLSAMREKSAGVVSIYDFLRVCREKYENHPVLALDHGHAEHVIWLCGLRHWGTIYEDRDLRKDFDREWEKEISTLEYRNKDPWSYDTDEEIEDRDSRDEMWDDIHTARFMETVLEKEKKPIVFFMPRNFFTYKFDEADSGDGVLQREYEILMKNALEDTVFVFGSYNFNSLDSTWANLSDTVPKDFEKNIVTANGKITTRRQTP